MRSINWKWLRRRSIHAGFAGACIAMLITWAPTPEYWEAFVEGYGIPTVLLLLAISHLQTAVSREDEWKPMELDLLRKLAVAGWVVLPEADGGYTAHGPAGQRQWHDHWRDVEEWANGEVQLCSAN